ncbi:hypothetical protein [Asaia krungthepensis]|uniref:Uncharacterized protein n=1 Tax=Asaia krungthepensis NRIC 0535 TaxID=1307925 RepID=A0ABQ0Q2G1_9PROT|nr:hypothetical protein [Asaia krungthepensis]GBQ88188.1 hypothetical protein AA0535_1477 [Asaia krungthepensis NRIC 0535]
MKIVVAAALLSLSGGPVIADAQTSLTPPQMSIRVLDRFVTLMNEKTPLKDNEMATILSLRREGRKIVETIALTHVADEAIFNFSETELKRMITNADTERYCSTNMKFLMSGNVTVEFIYMLRGREFFRTTRSPAFCTVVN